MKKFTALQLSLLQQLGDGHCHSGSELGRKTGVSRTAIWKQISQLTNWGLGINRLPQQGYQFDKPFIPLDETQILARLADKNLQQPVNIHCFAEIDSTNQFLKELPLSSDLVICCAETQTRGRGRFGRSWISPFGENIYFSSRWRLDCCLSKLSGLSLVVSLAVSDCLRNYGIGDEVKIKWPNDLLWQHKKLCGILIEIVAESNDCAQIIIGIGLNVNGTPSAQQCYEKPACSLHEISGRLFDRNQIIADLLAALDRYMQRFLAEGFGRFIEEWNKTDYLAGNRVTLTHYGNQITGMITGVNEQGQLCLLNDAGEAVSFSSGDTSLQQPQP
ncbi:biotin--[acetyl-CoA-carboxylase] ligase [Legionella dresdenensis]|uniref:Bifunctional ligase/repressor BirA n=1 Tax=Legionella dresdenensis TaxID=450200 RepID=A0ABV8CCQ2_9GAMM